MLKMEIIGHLGKDAVVNNVNGKSVINFSVAHTEKYKDQQGNQQSKTTWVECSKWGDNTAVAPYLKKGGQVFCEGTPEVKTFQKQDGTTGTSLTLRVMNLQLLGSPEGGNQQQQQQQPQQQWGQQQPQQYGPAPQQQYGQQPQQQWPQQPQQQQWPQQQPQQNNDQLPF